MAFWGVEIKPGKPYTHQYDDEKGRLHVSQATLGTGKSKEKTVVVCNVGDKKPIYLCSLLPKRMETCPLNVEFEEYEEVTFSVDGPHSIHLSGFFYGESPASDGDEYESDSYEDGSFEAESDSGENTDYDTEDDEDDFIDNDIDMFPASAAAKSGVRIEEIVDDEKPANATGISKQSKKKKNLSSNSNDNGNSQRQLVLKNATSVPVLESEDEDGFPVSSHAMNGSDALSSKEKAEESSEKDTGGQAKKKRSKDDSDSVKSAKRKREDLVKGGEPERDTDKPIGSSIPTPEIVPDSNVKKVKKNKNKTVRDGKEKVQEAGSGNKSTVQPEEAKSQMQTSEKQKNTKKNKKKNKQQETAAGVNTGQNVSDEKGSTNELGKKDEAKPFQARSFPNGLVIEELEMGKPEGKRASPGKKVSVHYIGTLKKNGKIFDSNIGRSPFKFRLGVGEVIKGWDVGINGMRVGDKRRLTIPPAMGYGAKGAGGAIPPNSWLVFCVELVDVN